MCHGYVLLFPKQGRPKQSDIKCFFKSGPWVPRDFLLFVMSTHWINQGRHLGIPLRKIPGILKCPTFWHLTSMHQWYNPKKVIKYKCDTNWPKWFTLDFPQRGPLPSGIATSNYFKGAFIILCAFCNSNNVQIWVGWRSKNWRLFKLKKRKKAHALKIFCCIKASKPNHKLQGLVICLAGQIGWLIHWMQLWNMY